MEHLGTVNLTDLNELEIIGLLASKNLSVGTWKNQKGEMHVALTRMGRYNKNIAIPVDVLPAVIDALQNKLNEVTA